MGTTWTRPERALRPPGMADRFLAATSASLALRCGAIERWRLAALARQAMRASETLAALDDTSLVAAANALRQHLHRDGITDTLAVQGLALASEASRRFLGKRPYPVQLMGAFGLLRGRMIEMATGEGKTLTATLPCLTLALAGIPVHIVSVNDYLARRDAALAQRLLAPFGVTVGVVTHLDDDDAKRTAYQQAVCYCVDKDLVFDYLRDRLGPARTGGRPFPCQRGLYFALVDEADSILIDEARTPLVIARERAPGQDHADAALALRLAGMLSPALHFRAEHEGRRYKLTEAGRASVRARYTVLRQATALWHISAIREELVEQALAALHAYRRGTEYVVVDHKIQIVDESTGRILADRSWQRGLHQMIELKEGLAATAPRDTIARQTYPEHFARYLRIAGMTGTGREVAGEMRANFGMFTVAIPTYRASARIFLGVRVFLHAAQRWEAVASRAGALARAGRAVLIGTKSVQASEALSAALQRIGQPHRVLNALCAEREAEIVGAAGEPGCVTVATNMAGRGTDISLASSVHAAGGLHVILTEFHASSRIDRQLYGRAARQGDPGSCEAMVSLEDDIFLQFSPVLTRWLATIFRQRQELPRAWHWLLQHSAQARAERTHAAVRRSALTHDQAMRRALALTGEQA